jgi:hypothetical protein
MHLCNPDDHHSCTAWCQGETHVDLAYCDPALLAEIGVQPEESFQRHHQAMHVQAYQTPACTIVSMKPAPEALSAQKRYGVPVLWHELSAYLVTYQVHTPNQENPLWPAGQ